MGVSAYGAVISAGQQHSLFLRNSGQVWAAGINTAGQLGDGTTIARSVPTLSLASSISVSAGADYSLFMNVGGLVFATGRNLYGQFGVGGSGSSNYPTPILVFSAATAISANGAHSLFLRSGAAWAAGINTDGRLGDGTTTNRSQAVQVMTGVTSVSAGANHSLFLKGDGSVWAAGYNDVGQLGDGTTTSRSMPVQVMGGVSAISAGLSYSLFLKNDGTVWATGSNTSGQFGIGTTTSRLTPIQVAIGVVALSASPFGSHSLFLKGDRSVWSTGSNSEGQLGDGTTTNRSTPVQVMTGVVECSAGGSHSLFLTADSVVWGVGSNSSGQIGEGISGGRRLVPVRIIALTPLTQVVTFPSLADRTVKDSPISLTATASSGLPVSFSVANNGVTVSGSTLTVTAAGSYVIRAFQPGNSIYAPAESTSTITVAQSPQTLTFPVLADRLANEIGASFVLSAAASSGLPITYSVVSGPAIASVGGNGQTLLRITGLGSITVRASQPGNSIWAPATPVTQTFVVSKIPQTVAFPSVGGRVFGTLGIELTATSSARLPLEYSVVNGPASVSGSTLTLTGAGSITVRAFQAGNSTFLPAEATMTFVVTPNVTAPSSIEFSTSWFYDNVSLGTAVGQFSTNDTDVGDVITYSLVAGPGSGDNSNRDNARFRIVNNALQTNSTAFAADPNRTQLIRVRATDLAGGSVDKAIVLTLVSGSPFAVFERKSDVFTTEPSYVNAIFRLSDSSGRGLNLPQQLLEQANDIFQVRENGIPISPSESFVQVGKIAKVPSKVRTILLLDNSFSVGASLGAIKTAAKVLVDGMFDQQEIAVYSFSGAATRLRDFTGKSAANQLAIKAAIDTIALGSPTSNIYGSVLEMLNLPEWRESFSDRGIETGFLVIISDGKDEAGLATLDQVLTKRNPDNKQIFTIGLGAELNAEVLRSLGNAGYLPVAQVGGLSAAFAEIQRGIEDSANSYYWLNYASPKRGNFARTLSVALKNNRNPGANGTLNLTFNSAGFTDVTSAVAINRNVDATSGVSRLAIPKDAATIAQAFTILPPFGTPTYTWALGDNTLATLAPIGADSGRVTIIPKGIEGATTLTLTDTVSRYTKTIPLIIGSGAVLPRLINLSILTSLAAAGDSFTMGYVVGGKGTSGAKSLVVRAAGPSLGALGVGGTLDDPKLELFAGSNRTGENDNWGGTAALVNAMAGVGAFPYSSPSSRDAAAALSIPAGDNSVIVTGGNGTGTVIAEIYDATPTGAVTAATPRLVNVSVRKHIGAGLTAGFVIGGTASKTVLIRAVGPGLAAFGVGGTVTDPKLELFNSASTSIGGNDNWGGTTGLIAAFGAVGAFTLDGASKDAAILATLQPGNYTVQVAGVGGTTGVAIVEVYEVP